MCTRIFWPSNPIANVVSRTMDWNVSDEVEMWLLPAGMKRTGRAGDSSVEWVSQQGSIALSAWGLGSSDGMNESGLAAHGLFLGDSVYPPVDVREGISILSVVQYVLDTCSTVAEAVSALSSLRIEGADVHGQPIGAHYALDDASGDSAIIEVIDGKQQVHHGAQYTVMANDPAYDLQLANLRNFRPFGGDEAPPGDITSIDRFVRASYFLHYLPEPTTELEAVAGVVQLARNVAVPYGAPHPDFGTYPTLWISAANLDERVYFFGSTRSPNLIWVELSEQDLSVGGPVRRLDPNAVELVGEVSARLTEATPLY